MARRGFLDYVLSGAVGGLEGLAQQRAAEDEKKRIADALARQVRMDTVAQEDRATEKEDREQAKKDRLRSQRQSLLAGGYVPKGLDMPGATPRQPVSTETVDGQEFALYSTPRQLALQAAMEDAQLKARFKPAFRTPISTVGETGVSLINPENGKTQFVKFPLGFTPKNTDRPSSLSEDEMRMFGGQYLARETRNQGLINAMSAAIAKNPESANDPELLAYKIMKGRVVPNYKPPKPSEMSEKDKLLLELKADIAKKKRGGASKGAGAPTPTATTPAAAPAKTPTSTTAEAALSGKAQRKINEIQSSDLTPEEKQEKVQQVNVILSREIMKARGQG